MTSRRRSRGRRGLAVLAWGFGLFALAQLGGGLALDYLCPDVRFPSFGQVLRAWRARGRTPEVLCIGSSRFGGDIVPPVMRGAFHAALGDDRRIDVFNASVPVGDPICEEYEFHYLVRDGRRPRMLVLEISPETVNAYNEWYAVHVSRQLTWKDVPAHTPYVWEAKQLARLTAARLLPLFVHREEIGRRLARLGQPSPVEGDGDADQVINWNQMMQTPAQPRQADERRDLSVAGTVAIQNRLRYYHIGGTTAAALEHILDRCRQLHIAVVLVGVPITSYGRKYFTPEIDAAYHDYMARLCRTYSCRFVDWRDRLPDSDFNDVYHVSSAGGAEFSWRLTCEVLAPAWRETYAGGSPAVSAISP